MEVGCVSVLFGRGLVTFAGSFLANLAGRIVRRVLRFYLKMERLNNAGLAIEAVKNGTLSSTIASVCLVVRVAPLRLVGLPVRFYLGVLVHRLFRGFQVGRQAIGAASCVGICLNDVFQERSGVCPKDQAIARHSAFRDHRTVRESIRSDTLTSAVRSTRGVSVQARFP